MITCPNCGNPVSAETAVQVVKVSGQVVLHLMCGKCKHYFTVKR